MKKLFIISGLPLFLTSCNIGDSIGFAGIVVLFVIMLLLFGVMLFLVYKKKRQADKSLAKFSASIQAMLNKFETPEEKVETLKILIDRINNDDKYRKDEIWRDQVLVKVYLFLATQYHKLGDENQTLRVCTKILELDPKDGMTYYNRGSIYSNMGLYDKALQDLNMTIELIPSYGNAYNNRGFVYAKLGYHQEAVADYTEAIKEEPTAIAYYNRAHAYAELGQYTEASRDYNAYLETDTNNQLGLKADVERELSYLKDKIMM